MATRPTRHWLSAPRLLAVALAAVLVALLQLYAGQALQLVERFSSDLSWKFSAGSPERPERRLVVIDIDEASLKQVGAWPWPRGTIEQLSGKLAAAGVAVQVFDMVFPERRDDDARLAAAWAASPVVAGQIISIEANVSPQVGVIEGALGIAACPPFAPSSSGYIANNDILAHSGAALGHMTPRFEDDGVVRRVPALICPQGKAYPTLGLAALWRLAQPASTGRPS